jgi:hypothetical protein
MPLKTDVSRAKRLMISSRLPLEKLIEKQQAKLTQLDERIGRLMTARVDEEEVLGELLQMRDSSKEAR